MNPFSGDKKPKVLISQEQIQARVVALGQQIKADYSGVKEPLVLVGVLKGSVIFLSDLCRAIDMPVELEFMCVSSYGDATTSSGEVRITHDLRKPIQKRHVMFVEDIVDTGLTAKFLLDYLRSREPESLKFCSLLEKPERQVVSVDVDYVGFTIPDHFVVGYGLDFRELYRNLPYVGVLENA